MIQIDRAARQRRADIVSSLLIAHGGGIELVDSDRDDTVRVRFTGLCTACPMRPNTMAALVSPAFKELEGVQVVEAEGGRLSDEASERLTRSVEGSRPLGTTYLGMPALNV